MQQTFGKGSRKTVDSLRNMKEHDWKKDLPTLNVSTDKDDATKKREDRQYELDCTEDKKDHKKKLEQYEADMEKACAKTWDKHTPETMKGRIMNLEDFESATSDKPIALLSRIREVTLMPKKSRYHYDSLTEAMLSFLQCKQKDKENENLRDCCMRWKQAKDDLKEHTGDEWIKHCVKQTKQYKEETDATVKDELEKDSFKHWTACVSVRNASDTKYATLKQELRGRYGGKLDEHPRSPEAACDRLMEHKWDNTNEKKKNHNKEQNKNETDGDAHVNMNQQKADTRACYACGAGDHIKPNCDVLKKDPNCPKDKWFINQAVNTQRKYNQHQEDMKAEDDKSADRDAMSAISNMSNEDRDAWGGSKKEKKTGVSGLQLGINMNNNKYDNNDLRKKWMNEFILDSGTAFSMLANEKLAEKMFEADEPIDMHANAGRKILNKQATVPGFGDMDLNKDGLANIFGLDDLMQRGCRVCFDSDAANAFKVHNKNKELKGEFKRTNEGLCSMRVGGNKSEDNANINDDNKQHRERDKMCNNMITTEKEAKRLCTPEQRTRAVRARRLFDAAGPMTTENFKAVLRTNVVQDNHVKQEDCDIADAILNPKSESHMQGKWVRQQPKKVAHTDVAMPAELIVKCRDVVLCVDTMHVSSVAFLATIDKTVKCRGCESLMGQTDEDHYKALDKVLRTHNAAGFRIKTIEYDGLCRSMMDEVKDSLNIDMNYCNPDEHVPQIERSIRVIKERCRTHCHRMPFKMIPRTMIRALGEQCCKLLNVIPAKGGVSKHFSPHMIMNKTHLQYDKDFKHVIGDYGMANAPTDDAMKPRAVEAIYLRPIESAQGGHECMHLQTGKRIQSTRFHPLLITETVMRQVEKLATQQGTLSFKITTRDGKVLYDSAKIAGVDDENDNEDESINEECEIYNDEFEEVEEQYDSSDEETSECSAASNNEANYEQNNNEENTTDSHNDENDSEGTDEDADGHEDDDEEVETAGLRRSDRTTREVERLDPQWKGQIYHQTKKEHAMMNKHIKNVNDEVEQMNYSREEITRDLECNHNVMWQTSTDTVAERTIEHSHYQGVALARFINEFQEKVTVSGYSYAQQYLLSKGLKVFGVRGKKASTKELDQLHRRNCFIPVSIKDMTIEERKRAQTASMFLTEKRDGSVKGRMVHDGEPTREWLNREESASPTAATESAMLTSCIDAHEQRDVMTGDMPNAFMQAKLPRNNKNKENDKNEEDGHERVMMKITGVLVDMLVQLNPNLHSKYVVCNNGKKALHAWVLRALYGMLTSSLVWHKKFRKDLENYGFEFNPYDPCVASRTVKGQQHTIRFHVDDMMSSHRDKNMNAEFGRWLNEKHGKHKPVEPARGKRHDFLGMNLDFTEPKVLNVDMCGHVDNMVDTFPIEFDKDDINKYPAGDKLFDEGADKLLNEKDKEQFHTAAAKGSYVSKRARPDMQLTIAVLCTRVQNPNKDDWNKLVHLLKFLNGARNKKLRITADNLAVIKWHVDASFAAHPDYKSHAGATMTFDGGVGSVMNLSRKQKLNTRSSTEAELVGVDDASVLILWTKLFLEALGHAIKKNVTCQDNKSAMLLETDGRQSAGKRSRALNIRCFFITDQVEKGNAAVEHCNTDDMVGDFHTKPVQGHKHKKFGDTVMGIAMFHIWNIVGKRAMMSLQYKHM